MTGPIQPRSARTPIFRVIFDRSAFHGARFDALVDSPLLELCGRGSVEVFHSQPFIEETLLTYAGGSGDPAWQKHLAYALDTCSGGFFLDRDDIWHDELVAGRGPFARYLLPKRGIRRTESHSEAMDRLRAAATSGDISVAWKESELEREATKKKKANQRAIFSGIRSEIAQALKGGAVKGSLKDYPFAKFRASELIHTGRIFMDIVHRTRARQLANIWSRDPQRFPFYTAFVEGAAYSGYYAAVEHNQPLDENAQVDFEQLCYLTWADIFVSNDQKFMRRAFDAIWKPRGKRLFTAEEFASLLKQLA